MPNSIKPIIVLTIITTITAALLITANNIFKVDDTVLSSLLTSKCIEIMGEGEFEVIPDWLEAGYAIPKPKSVTRLIKKSDGTLAFHIVADGYNKDGLSLLVAMNSDGSVMDLTIYKLNETPGIGEKVNTIKFLNSFIGKAEEVQIAKSKSASNNQITAVSGATYSSKGVAKAVNVAISVYKELGAIVLKEER